MILRKNIFYIFLSIMNISSVISAGPPTSARMLKAQSAVSCCETIKYMTIKGIQLGCTASILIALHNQDLCQQGYIHSERYAEFCDPTHVKTHLWFPAIILGAMGVQKTYSYLNKKLLELYE